ncbi:MAG: hypothetical protein IJ455_01850 [Agathobacter sp.]|nr:hypothetical protein [Agathobacter sp.]
MKVSLDFKKGAEALADVKNKTTELVQKTSETGKQVAVNIAENIQKSALEFSEKSKNDSYERRLKKYNPLFPEKYHSEKFNLPNMIIIVDDAVRRDIDVCEGAIGWLSNQKGMEVLHLYDEYIKESGIQFVPAPICDAAYYVDRFDRNRFIQIECIFTKAHEERMAELKNIAYMLGAKYCSIEISETTSKVENKKKKVEAKIGTKGISTSSHETVEQESSYEGYVSRSGKIEATFGGSDEVKRPELKWFMHDDTIKRLIDMRCANINAIKSETLVLEGSSSATMSKKTACAIDNAVGKIGVSGNANMEGQALKEEHSKLIFRVEF